MADRMVFGLELLESAISAPQATMMGQALIADPLEIAAAYLFYLCSNYPFVDGNKRVALATCMVFLSSNKLVDPHLVDFPAWKTLTLAVASGELERKEITERLRNLISA